MVVVDPRQEPILDHHHEPIANHRHHVHPPDWIIEVVGIDREVEANPNDRYRLVDADQHCHPIHIDLIDRVLEVETTTRIDRNVIIGPTRVDDVDEARSGRRPVIDTSDDTRMGKGSDLKMVADLDLRNEVVEEVANRPNRARILDENDAQGISRWWKVWTKKKSITDEARLHPNRGIDDRLVEPRMATSPRRNR